MDDDPEAADLLEGLDPQGLEGIAVLVVELPLEPDPLSLMTQVTVREYM